MSSEVLYKAALIKANEIELVLKRLNRWRNEPLSKEKLEDMGAFGSNTMTFEEWLQYILIPRIKEIVEEKGEFPGSSMIGTYGMRVIGNDREASELLNHLYELDELINHFDNGVTREDRIQTQQHVNTDQIEMGGSTIPPVVFTLAKLLPQYEGDHLESQLQTFDVFLNIMSPEVRPAISQLLMDAAAQTLNMKTKTRIECAAASIANGGTAATVYNHDDTMKKYIDDHNKSFPRI
jgi:uncharacterized protein YqcC (DUF446 family)